MKYISYKLHKNTRANIITPFDAELIKNIKKIEKGLVMFDYDLENSSKEFPISVSGASFVVRVTGDGLYPSAVVYADEENEKWPYADNGIVECLIELSDREEKGLMLHLIKHFGNLCA